VNSAIYSQTGGSVGIGFAIPASVAKPITDRLMRGESIERGYVGVGIQNLSRDQLEALGLPADFTGALVGEVTAGGPAEAGGVQIGDIVTRLNGTVVRDRTDLTRRIGQVRPGETIRLEVLRDGRRETLSIRVRVRPPESVLNSRSDQDPDSPSAQEGAGASVGGLTVAPMSEALRRRYSIPAPVNGLVVTAAETIGELNFRPGFVITRSGSGPIRTPAELQAAIDAARRANRPGVFLIVWTPQGNTPIVLPLPKPE
jgi:serine protease Do